MSNDSSNSVQVPVVPSGVIIQILRTATLDDNPLTGTTDIEEQAFEPALVDFMHAFADFLEASQTTIGVHAAVSLAEANVAVAHAAAHVDELGPTD
jgi:hypothetical protein